MIKVGITGGIGSGKTTVSKILQCMGYSVYNADVRGKWLMHQNTHIIAAVKGLFGNDIYLNDGLLNRPKVASIVFKNPEVLSKLNSIVHPAVAHDFTNWCHNENGAIIFKEAAILFESDAHKTLDKIICITAPEKTRIDWVIKRERISEKQIRERMQHQMSDIERVKLSDFVINNDGKQFVIPQLIKIIDQLKQA